VLRLHLGQWELRLFLPPPGFPYPLIASLLTRNPVGDGLGDKGQDYRSLEGTPFGRGCEAYAHNNVASFRASGTSLAPRHADAPPPPASEGGGRLYGASTPTSPKASPLRSFAASQLRSFAATQLAASQLRS
jgi:hypothetical protein